MLPINPETVKKRTLLPTKLSELSKINPTAALALLQDWGDGAKPVNVIWNEINEAMRGEVVHG